MVRDSTLNSQAPGGSGERSDILLLSTDFDGTLVDHGGSPQVSPELFEALEAMRARGALWAINTGRVLWHIEAGLHEFKFPFAPDYVLTSERELFHRDSSGKWVDYGDWNKRCAADHDALFEQASLLLIDIHARFDREPWAHFEYEGERMVGIVTETDGQMDDVCAFLERERLRIPGFNFMRNTIYLRFCHEAYSKGTALGELSRLVGIERENVFAAGDHYNDVPMLDGRFAKWVACPGNSCEPVKRLVRECDGYVADGTASFGIVEALREFRAL